MSVLTQIHPGPWSLHAGRMFTHGNRTEQLQKIVLSCRAILLLQCSVHVLSRIRDVECVLFNTELYRRTAKQRSEKRVPGQVEAVQEACSRPCLQGNLILCRAARHVSALQVVASRVLAPASAHE